MATNEERLDALEEARIQQEAAGLTLLNIVKDIKVAVDDIRGIARGIEAHQITVDTRLNYLDSRLGVTDVRTQNVWADMQRSFAQNSQEQARIEGKVDAMGEKIAALQGGQVEVNDKLDQVLALLSKGE